MSGCSQFGPDLSAFLDRELDAGARSAFEAHLVGCDPCRGALEAGQQLEASLHALPPIEPGPQFEAQFWARLAREGEARGLRARIQGWRPLGWLGAGAAVAGLALLLSTGHPAPSAQDWTLITGDDFDLMLEADPEFLASIDLLETWDVSGEF